MALFEPPTNEEPEVPFKVHETLSWSAAAVVFHVVAQDVARIDHYAFEAVEHATGGEIGIVARTLRRRANPSKIETTGIRRDNFLRQTGAGAAVIVIYNAR